MESTQRHESMRTKRRRIRAIAEADRRAKFTSLAHHLTVEALREAWKGIRKGGTPGVDGVTARQYARDLEGNLQRLHERLKAGQYRPAPVRRVYIPKKDGRRRPIGVPVLEDKIVQRATAELLSDIYEVDFLDFSYGFRPRRSPHDALEALNEALWRQKVNYVLDVDIQSFFDRVDRTWMRQFIEHRVVDRGILRLIGRWLRAGVMEQGEVTDSGVGTPQGGSISPLLANIYLHYAFDLWADRKARARMHGQMHIIRYCDDMVIGFEHREDAERFLQALKKRLNKFGLELHPEKTRLIEFGRHAAGNRKRRGEGKPETFNFLGFTHICSRSRKGRFKVVRKTMRQRQREKMSEVSTWCRRHRHEYVREQHKHLVSILRGYYQYYGVTGNYHALATLRYHVTRTWRKWLSRRSQKGHLDWHRYNLLLKRYPLPKVYLSRVTRQRTFNLSWT